MILGSLDPEVDQVAGMRYHGFHPSPQRMISESLHIRLRQGLGKPLHVVFHEDLHGRAAYPDTTVDSCRNSADRRHMRT